MIQDEPRHLIPADAVWDAKDVFIDQDGALMKRGGSKVIQSAGSAFRPNQNGIGILQSAAQDGLVTGYLASAQSALAVFLPGSGNTTITTISNGGVLSVFGVPFQHTNILVIPQSQATPTAGGVTFVGGNQTIANVQTLSNSTLTFTAGTNAVTALNAADTAKVEAGHILVAFSAANTSWYGGRVVSVSGTTITVDPTPTIGFVTAAGTATTNPNVSTAVATGGGAFPQTNQAVCGASWQNRVVLGGVITQVANGVYQREGSKLAWSLLPTEAGYTTNGITWDGIYTFANGQAYQGPTYQNWLTITGVDQIRSLVPINQDNLFILGTRGSAMITGQLVTETSSTRSFSYAVRTIQQGLGCMSQASVQKTAAGVMWASADGVCVFDGNTVTNVMLGKIANLWQSSVAAGITIYGSASLTPFHYYLSTSAGGFLCNLDGFRWIRTTGIGIYGAAVDPSSDQRTYAILNDSSVSTNNYKLHRIDTYLNPSASVTSDADATAVTPSVTTRVITGGDATRLKRFKHARLSLQTNGATTTITATPKIDATGTTETLGTVTTSANVQTAQFEPSNGVSTAPLIDQGVSYVASTASALTAWQLFGVTTEYRELSRKRVS
jgi:hypothetical protein